MQRVGRPGKKSLFERKFRQDDVRARAAHVIAAIAVPSCTTTASCFFSARPPARRRKIASLASLPSRLRRKAPLPRACALSPLSASRAACRMQSMDAAEGGAHGDAASTIAAFEKEELAREQLQMVKARTMCMSSPLLALRR